MAASICEDDGHTLKIEAKEVVKEIAYAVKSVEVSSKLPCTDNLVYLNLRTLEDKDYSVELSLRGFRIVSNTFDDVENSVMETSRFYETIYALLDNVSDGYKNTFGDTLLKRLAALQKESEEEESS